MSIRIPQPLFESLQAAFMGEAKRLCRDAAKILNVPENELRQKVLPTGSAIKLTIIDTEDAPTNCMVLIKENNVLRRCRCPTLLGTGRCVQHQTVTIPEVSESVNTLYRLKKIEEVDTPLWYDEKTNEVLDSNGAIVGKYKNETLELFEYEIESI